ncbi:MAG: hypothetical protein AB1454_12220 [Candidatus Auribacterota bacterium]
MYLKMILHFVIFILFFSGIYVYVVQKSKKCENKQCICPVKDNIRTGYVVIGILSLIVLGLLVLIEVVLK